MSRSHKANFTRNPPSHRPSKVAYWDAAECQTPEGKRKLKKVRRRGERIANRMLAREDMDEQL